jgi:hypothetical protein
VIVVKQVSSPVVGMLLSLVFASQLLAYSQVYLGMSDGSAAGGPAGPAIVRYNYDPTLPAAQRYSFAGAISLGAGNTADQIQLNSDPGSAGGIYTGISGSANVLREYSFDSGSFTQVREVGAELTDLAIGPDDRVFGYDGSSGNLANYQASGATFNQNAHAVADPGSRSFVNVGAGNQILTMGQDSANNAFMYTFSFDGSTYTPVSANGSGFKPDGVAISPLNNVIWTAENSINDTPNPGTGANFNVFQFAFEDDIAGCPGDDCPVGGPFPYAVAAGHHGSLPPEATSEIEHDQLVASEEGFAIGTSPNWDVGSGFGGRGTYLLGWWGNPHTIAGGTGFAGLKAATRLDGTGTRLVLDIDDDNTIHVFGDGFLRAYEISLFVPGDPSVGFAFNEVASIGGGILGGAQSIAAALAPAPEAVPGDYNNNLVVDAADYVFWRATQGDSVPPGSGADGTGPGGVPDGFVDSLDYDFWKERFGNTSGSASFAPTAVPEPSTLLMIIVGAFLLRISARRSR